MSAGTPFSVTLASSAARDLEAIPPRYASAVIAFITQVLPINPVRVGKPLRHDLEGLYGACRGDYRVLYEILDRDHAVLVVRIDHRARVYQ